MNEIKCTRCTHRFECLAKHFIPDNYGRDCKDYLEENK